MFSDVVRGVYRNAVRSGWAHSLFGRFIFLRGRRIFTFLSRSAKNGPQHGRDVANLMISLSFSLSQKKNGPKHDD